MALLLPDCIGRANHQENEHYLNFMKNTKLEKKFHQVNDCIANPLTKLQFCTEPNKEILFRCEIKVNAKLSAGESNWSSANHKRYSRKNLSN